MKSFLCNFKQKFQTIILLKKIGSLIFYNANFFFFKENLFFSFKVAAFLLFKKFFFYKFYLQNVIIFF